MPRWRSTGAGPSPGSPPHRAVGHAGAMVKVRIGYTVTPGPGVALTDLGPLAGELERLGFDSLWLPESMLTGAFDPVVGLTHVAAVTSRLKVGTHLVVPGRNPLRMARELASLDRLSDGRLLLIAVIGLPDDDERIAQGVAEPPTGARCWRRRSRWHGRCGRARSSPSKAGTSPRPTPGSIRCRSSSHWRSGSAACNRRRCDVAGGSATAGSPV